MKIGNIIENVEEIVPENMGEKALDHPPIFSKSMYENAIVSSIRKLDTANILFGNISSKQRKKLETLEGNIHRAIENGDEREFRGSIKQWQEIYLSTSKNESQERVGDEPSIRCPYRGKPRPVHPSVCEYHRTEEDEVCSGLKCPRIKLGRGMNKNGDSNNA